MKPHHRTTPPFAKSYVPIVSTQLRPEPVTRLEWYVQGIIFAAGMLAAIVLGATL